MAATATRKPASLSGGEMQRAAVARAVVHRPALVLADEPTGNLDEANAAATMQALREAVKREGAAGLLVTHSAVGRRLRRPRAAPGRPPPRAGMTGALAATLLRGSLSGNRWRSLLAIACIALGVALAGAVNTLHSSALDEIDRAARILAGTADLQARGPRNGFDDAAYAPVALHPAVAVASPVIEIEAPLGGPRGHDPRAGHRPLPRRAPAAGLPRGGRGEPRRGHADAPRRRRGAWLTPAALAKLRRQGGRQVALAARRGEVTLHGRPARLPALDGGGPLAVMDIAARATRLRAGRRHPPHRPAARPRRAARGGAPRDPAGLLRRVSRSPAPTRRRCAPPGSRRPTA